MEIRGGADVGASPRTAFAAVRAGESNAAKSVAYADRCMLTDCCIIY